MVHTAEMLKSSEQWHTGCLVEHKPLTTAHVEYHTDQSRKFYF